MKKIICFLLLIILGISSSAQNYTTVTLPSSEGNLKDIKTLQDAWASRPPGFKGAGMVSNTPLAIFLAPVDENGADSKTEFGVLCDCNLNIAVVVFKTAKYQTINLQVMFKGDKPSTQEVEAFISFAALQARLTLQVK